MIPLLQSLRSAGFVTALPVDASDVLDALSAPSGITPHVPFDVQVATGTVAGLISGATVLGDSRHARLVLPLHDAVLAASFARQTVTVTTGATAPDLTLEISVDGIRWSVAGPVAFGVTPDQVTLPGPVPVSLHVSPGTLSVEDGAPAVGMSGTVSVAGIPVTGELSAPFSVRYDRSGFNGSAEGQAGPVTFALNWCQARDPFPSSIDIATAFPAPQTAPVTDAAVEPGASRVRVRMARGSTGYATNVAVEAGDSGVLSSDDRRLAALGVLITSAAADTRNAPGRPGYAELGALIGTATALGEAFGTGGHARITAVRFDLGTPHQAQIDYEAELSCAVRAGFLDAVTTAPLRVAVRGATLDYHAKTPALSLAGACLDVSDTGRWEVTRPAGLLQVAGVRSGHGSSYAELDLRVAMDLGPLKVAGAVLRISLSGRPNVEVRGFDLDVDVPGLIAGGGRIAFDGSGGFSAALRVHVVPLNLAAGAGLVVEEASDAGRPYKSVLADLACDLPAPVPLADTGLGLYGVEALLGLNRGAHVAAGQDENSIKERLAWQPDAAHTAAAPREQLFGAGVAVATLPDLGFAFSSLGRLVVQTPDTAVVVALDARVLAERREVTEQPGGGGLLSLLGLLVVDPDELSAAVSATYRFPPGTAWALLEADVPADARYPVTSPQEWFVHLGSDGRRKHGCGPVSARVLPELFDIGADAFVMLHGDGFDPPLAAPISSPKNGFGAAAGFSFATRYGLAPVWADLSVAATLALGTRPLFVSGSARANGALHLGPFSLGLDARLDLQLGPGDHRYAKLEACGSIDLWFYEISGCVHLAFGEETTTRPEMPRTPLVSAAVADRAGVAAPDRSTLTATPTDAPAMWPDGTVLLGFAPGPLYTGPVSDPFHADLDVSSAVKGAGTLAAPDGTGGSSGYPARWSLTGLGLQRCAGGGPDQPVPGPLAASWQLPPGAPPLTPASGRVLALFARNPALWSLSLLDGGAKDPADPVAVHARTCRGQWSATAGWAVGGRAEADGIGWTVPPADERPAPATASCVRAVARTRVPSDAVGDVPAVPDWAAHLATGTALVPGEVVRDGTYAIGDLPKFQGCLRLADFVGPRTEEQDDQRRAVTVVTTDSPLEPAGQVDRGPTVVLWSERDFADVRVLSRFHPDSAQESVVDWEQVDQAGAPSGGVIGVFECPAAEPVRSLEIRHARRRPDGERLGPALGIVGVAGVTGAAFRAAATGRAAAQAAAAAQAQSEPGAQHLDSVFTEGATYRLDITWSGTLDGDPRPASGTTEQRYFKIAEHAPKDLPPGILQPRDLYRSVHVFHPRMLGRYLLGYSVDGGDLWFCGDRITATFSSRTIAQVAEVYGYDVKIVINRTDPPPGSAQDDPLFTLLLGQVFSQTSDTYTVRPSERVDLLEAVDRRGVAQSEAGCAWPREPVDVDFQVQGLEPDAAYEVGVLAEPEMTALGPRLPDRVPTMLPTAAFHTGHWPSPAHMLDALGWNQPDPPLRHRAVRTPVAPPQEDSDGALLSALSTAGADPGPLDAHTRTTVMWTPDGSGGYGVDALLLEADEPLERGRRVGGFTMSGFTKHTDSGGTAMLFVAARPAAAGPLSMIWQEHYHPGSGAWLFSHPVNLQIPDPATLPALAWEVWP